MSGISRRLLMRGGAAAGLLAMAGGAGAMARPQGTLRLGLPALPEAIGGAGWRGLAAAVLGPGLVFETLTQVTASGALAGELATGWRAEAGHRRWIFGLREGARFHDGTPVLPADVAASLEAARSGPSGALLADLEGVEARGAAEIVLHLAAPHPDFPFRLAEPLFGIAPGGDQARGIGSGLYRLAEFDGGARAVLDRADGHWRTGEGAFARVEVRALADPRDRIEAIRAGRLDAAPVTGAEAAAPVRGVRIVRSLGNQHYRLECGDPALARAIARTIDRERMVAEALAGFGRVGADHGLGPANVWRDETLAPPPRDPFRARAILAGDGRAAATLTLWSGPAVPAGVVREVRAAAAEAGLTLRTGAEAGADLRLVRASGRLTEDWALGLGREPGLAAEIEAARTAPDRAHAYAALQARMAAEGSVVIPAFAEYLLAHGSRIAPQGPVGTLFDLDDGRIAQRWRLA